MLADRPDRRAGSLRFIFITTTMRLGTSWKAQCVFAGERRDRSALRLSGIRATGTAHPYRNPGPGPMRYLLVMTSKTYALIQEIHAMKDRSSAALRAVFEKHDSELVDE